MRNVIVVSHYDQLLEDSHIAIKLPPDKADWPYAILAVVAGQVAALELGERTGVDVDTPFGLRKATLTT